MQTNLALLHKKAINFALKADWPNAITTNLYIIEKDPKNIDAKLRLGRAYLNTSQFLKAKRLFEDVLKSDPINPIAKKYLLQSKEKRAEKANGSSLDPSSLIKEPGTTTEVELEITARGVTADNFLPSEPLKIVLTKTTATYYKVNGTEKEIASHSAEYVKRLYSAKQNNAHISANFLKGEGKKIMAMIHSSLPIFKESRQDVKPYTRGIVDDVELEMTEPTQEEM